MRGRRAVLLAAALALSALARAAGFDYRLEPARVADDTYVLVGAAEHFSTANGGNIVNTGFIVTGEGVVVIDTGPSRRYGEQLRAAIARVTDAPVTRVVITHHHPDHLLGNQAFADVPIGALAATVEAAGAELEGFTDNLYGLLGDWMRGTEAVLPGERLAPGVLEVGGHRLRLLALDGHTGADLAVLDERTGVLFAGDLVFHDRAPTTPHARIGPWLAALDILEGLPFRVLVPGHGPVSRDPSPIAQTRDYLRWLDARVRRAAGEGWDMMETIRAPVPGRFARLAVLPDEYHRSVVHLFPRAEEAVLPRAPRHP